MRGGSGGGGGSSSHQATLEELHAVASGHAFARMQVGRSLVPAHLVSKCVPHTTAAGLLGQDQLAVSALYVKHALIAPPPPLRGHCVCDLTNVHEYRHLPVDFGVRVRPLSPPACRLGIRARA
jgi:hypothetical protein